MGVVSGVVVGIGEEKGSGEVTGVIGEEEGIALGG